MEKIKTDPAWPCGWEAHELEQLKHGMSMTFLQKLKWLEETTAFSKILQNAPVRTMQEMKAAHAKSNAAKDLPRPDPARVNPSPNSPRT